MSKNKLKEKLKNTPPLTEEDFGNYSDTTSNDNARHDSGASTSPPPKDSNSTQFNADEWPELVPLYRELPPGQDFPVEALGSVLAGAAKAIARCVQVPLAIAGQSVLAAANLVAQPHVDYSIDGRQRPISLYLGTGAESGDRKTSTDEAALSPIKEAGEILLEQDSSLIVEAKIDLEVWQSERNKIKNSKKLSRYEKKQQLKDLGQEPIVPAEPIFTLEDITIEGLRRAYKEGRASLGFFTNEAATFFNGWSMSPEQQLKTAASLCKGWDGQPIEVARGGDGLIILRHRRLCMNLFMQPEILRMLLSNETLLHQGYLSRVLTALTVSIAGTRPQDELPDEKNLLTNDSAYQEYKDHLLKLALLPLPFKDKHKMPGVLQPRPLFIEGEARLIWVKFYNSIEVELSPGKKLFPVKAFANKTPEHAQRIAGTEQFLITPDGSTIGADEMANGIELAKFYLNEQLRLSAFGEIPPGLQAAAELLDFLRNRRAKTGDRFFSTVEIYEKRAQQTQDVQ